MTVVRAFRIRALMVAALLLAGPVLAPALAQQTMPAKGPFGADRSAGQNLGQSRPGGEQAAALSLLQRAGAWVMAKQAAVNRELATAVRRLKTGDPFSAALTLGFLSFAYGVLHAAGPGHGKAVISSYVLADGRTVRRGIALAFLAALVQALSALLLVAVLLLALRATGVQMRAMEAWLETASWGLVALVGGWLVYHQLRDVLAPAHVHDHGSADGHRRHDHGGEACEMCAHLPDASQIKGDWSWRRALALAFAVGVRPCTGAILVLVFAIGQGLMWAGVFSTFAMAIGTAITVSVLAACAVGFRQAATRLAGGGSSRWADRVQLAAGLGGAFLVLLLGAVFFIASLGTPRPF